MRTFRRILSCSPVLLLLGALACGDDETPLTGPTTRTAEADPAAAAVLSFRQISAGNDHTCGVTTGDQAYCWGDNGFSTFGGQLGDGTTIRRLKPVAVLGGLSFRQVSAGVTHTCAVTTDNRAYCWGRNDYGQLGDGTTESRLTPVPVAGGRRRYSLIGVGHDGCGVTLAGAIYCWNSESIARVASGTLRFLRVSVSGIGAHRCAVAVDNQAYCWGSNSDGQLGNGSTNPSTTPVAVAAPE
jgi:alpha-tubulin suppressor-like RCC1 family protein